MVFGDEVTAPADIGAAAWIHVACRGRWGTVGGLVPNGFDAFVRVAAPDPDVDDWWDAYRSLYQLVASVGARHTTTPTSAWFGVWEGYGWETSTTMYVTSGRPGWAGRRKSNAERKRLREKDRRRHEAVRTGLAGVPRFEVPGRAYYLVGGPIAAAADVREPGSPDRWQRPDLMWPDDQAWFVASDVDFWSLYVGGSAAFIDDLVASLPVGSSERVTLDRELVSED